MDVLEIEAGEDQKPRLEEVAEVIAWVSEVKAPSATAESITWSPREWMFREDRSITQWSCEDAAGGKGGTWILEA